MSDHSAFPSTTPAEAVNATELLPCPFCGGEAERIDNGPNKEQIAHAVEWGEDTDDDGTFIRCKQCDASTALHFERRENLIGSWNNREPLVVGDMRISMADDGLIYIRSKDGEGGMFDLSEFVLCVRRFVSARL